MLFYFSVSSSYIPMQSCLTEIMASHFCILEIEHWRKPVEKIIRNGVRKENRRLIQPVRKSFQNFYLRQKTH